MIDHAEHKFDFIITSAPGIKKMLVQHLDPLKEIKGNLSRAIKEIGVVKSKIESQGDVFANKIETTFKEYQEIIEKRKQDLLKEAATRVSHKLENLSGQEKTLSTEYAVIQSVIEYTEHCVEHSNDDEVLSTHGDIWDKIDREIKSHHSLEKCLDPLEEVDVGVEMCSTEDLHHFLESRAKVFQMPIEYSVEKTEARVNEESYSTLKFTLSNGKSTKLKNDIKCQLKSLSNGSIVNCTVGKASGGCFYRPTVRGRHKLIITSNRQEVPGSPFPVFVTIPPTQLGKPVKVIAGVKNPVYMAINSSGELLFTEPNSNQIEVMDKQGKSLRKLKLDSNVPEIKKLYGIAVDDDDNVYASDHISHVVVKLSTELEVLKKVTTGTNDDSNLWGIAVVGDEVLVCDGKYDCIIVYSKDLEYIRKIGSHGKGPGEFYGICDLSPDQQGNLYICDSGNSRIQVFSIAGDYLRSFGCMNFPIGIFITYQYVYVTSHTEHIFAIYTTEGERVASFGHKGADDGDFNCPRGICCDNDGFVYVCDLVNSRVHVF